MSCIENFSWVATEWHMLKDTIADANEERIYQDDQHAAYVYKCIDRFNEVTAHLALLTIRNDQELQQSIHIIRHLTSLKSGDDYATSIEGLLANIAIFIGKKTGVTEQLAA